MDRATMQVLTVITLLSFAIKTVTANCGVNYAALNGTITSPNYPFNYPDDQSCIWLLQCPLGKIVSVLIDVGEIERDKTCAFDYITFRDNSASGQGLLPDGILDYDTRQEYKFCGSLGKLRWNSKSIRMWVKFVSDDGTTDSGFFATWRCEDPPAPTTSKTTIRQSTKVNHKKRKATSPTVAKPKKKRPTTFKRTTPIPTTAKGVRPTAKTKSIPKGPDITTEHGGKTAAKNGPTEVIKTTKTTVDISNAISLCYAELYKNINWGSTYQDTLSKRPCATGESGPVAIRKCLSRKGKPATWSTFVDTSRCVSSWMKGINNKVKSPKTTALDGITSILNITLKNYLLSGDIVKIVHLVKDLLKKAEKKDLVNPPPRLAESLHKEFVLVGSKLLDSSAWNGMPKKKQTSLATALLKNLENLGLAIAKVQFASFLGNVGSFSAVSPNIVSTTTAINPSVNKTVEIFNPKFKIKAESMNTDWRLLGQIKIPEAVVKQVTGSKSPCYCSSVTTRNIARLLSPGYGQKIDDNVKIPFDDNTASVNTFVTSLALSPSPNVSFVEPIIITSKHLQKIRPQKSKTKCSYWNTSKVSPGWSQAGVVTALVSASETQCQTYHLTNFAVLMQTGTFDGLGKHRLALKIITQVGIGLSLLALILSFTVFSTVKSLQSVRNTIHKNLSASLAMAYVVFIVGISRTENQIACTVFASALYYLLLVAFLWMLMEGIQLYILLVQIFPRGDGFKKHYYAIAWGFPAALTIVLCSSYPNGFGNDEFCWLSVKDHFIWAFVIPVLIIVAINTIFLGMTFKIVIRNSSIIARDHEMRKTVDKIGYWAKGSVGLVPLLGITWIFGVLYINEDSFVMAYLFTFFNAFQGFFIFVFYCCMNDKVKEDFKNRLFPMYRSNSHSNGSKRNSRLSFTAVQMPWQRQPTSIPTRDPAILGRSANGTFTRRYQDVIREDAASPDYDPAVLYSFSRGQHMGNEYTEFRCSGHSSDSRDSKSGLMLEDDEGFGTGPRPSTSKETNESSDDPESKQSNGQANGHASAYIPVKTQENGHVPNGHCHSVGHDDRPARLRHGSDGQIQSRTEPSRRNRSSPDIRHTDDFGSYEPDEFEEKILKELERNARRAKSTEIIDTNTRYNHTVYV